MIIIPRGYLRGRRFPAFDRRMPLILDTDVSPVFDGEIPTGPFFKDKSNRYLYAVVERRIAEHKCSGFTWIDGSPLNGAGPVILKGYDNNTILLEDGKFTSKNAIPYADPWNVPENTKYIYYQYNTYNFTSTPGWDGLYTNITSGWFNTGGGSGRGCLAYDIYHSSSGYYFVDSVGGRNSLPEPVVRFLEDHPGVWGAVRMLRTIDATSPEEGKIICPFVGLRLTGSVSGTSGYVKQKYYLSGSSSVTFDYTQEWVDNLPVLP